VRDRERVFDRAYIFARSIWQTVILLSASLECGDRLAPRANAAQTYADFLVGGLARSTGAAFAPGDTSRIFVTEQFTGDIRLVDLRSRTLLPTPVLHRDTAFQGDEQGLLGLAFDPDFASNGFFYLNYTPPGGDTHIVRFRMVGDPLTSTVADPNSALTLLTIDQPQVNHNGGWLDFGPDGYLYIGMGDGGGGLDTGPGHNPEIGNAQDLTDNLLGKILRLDVRGDAFPNDPLRNYAIPPTNPFVGKEGDDEIWAYGLRNPWRASFDQLTGDLWIADVGESSREEINFLSAGHPGGANFGWRLREGTIATPVAGIGGPAPPGAIEPVYDYPHAFPETEFSGGAVTGGFVYRGPVEAFQGLYFFNDTNNGNMWTLDPDAVDIPASVQTMRDKLPRSFDGIFLGQIPSWTEDDNGDLYAVQLISFGGVYRVATHSQDVVWNGDDRAAGAPGDGQSWSQAANWTRGTAVDSAFVAEDHVIFARGSSQPTIKLEGEQVISAATFNAPYTLEQGTLRILSGNVTVAEGVTATIESDVTAETEHRSIRKLGAGTLLVQGRAGQIAVKQGTLAGRGTLHYLTVRAGSTVAPGNPLGTLSVEQSLTLHAGATLEIELAGTDNSDPLKPQYDQLAVGGSFNLAGTLDVKLVDDGETRFAPTNGDSFAIFNAADGFHGEFDELNLPDLGPLLTWQIDRSAHVMLLRTVSALAGDYNASGEVDAADYIVWRDLAGQTEGQLAADGTGPQGERDGVVDNWDYNLWRANFGARLMSGEQTAAGNVPEPSALLIAVIAALVLVTRRPNAARSCRAGRRIAPG
jgi:glucose/arabinose dehydrogenase